MADGLDSLPR